MTSDLRIILDYIERQYLTPEVNAARKRLTRELAEPSRGLLPGVPLIDGAGLGAWERKD